MGRLVFGCLFATLVLACPAWAAAPPARLTPAQQQRLQESNRQFQQANALFKQGKTLESIQAARQALALQRVVFGRLPLSRCNWLEWMAGHLQQREDFPGAEQALAEVLSVRRFALGESHWQTTDARLALAHGKRLAGLSTEQRKRLSQAERWNSQGENLHRQGKYVEALPLAARAAEARKELLGEKDRRYADSLFWLAFLYDLRKDHARALSLYQQTVKLRKEVLGEKHPKYADSLTNLAGHYHSTGDTRQAVRLMQQAVKLRKEVLGEGRPNTPTA